MTELNSRRDVAWPIWGRVLLALIYIALGKLALLLAVPPGYVSPLFPAAGVAIGAAFVGGSIVLPWVFLGAFILNIWGGGTHLHQFNDIGAVAALLIAAASTLQAGVGGWVLRCKIGYPASLDSGRDIVVFMGAVVMVCLISATLSVGGLTSLGILSPRNMLQGWGTWWAGDTFGCVIALPILMTAIGEPRRLWRSRIATVAVPMLMILLVFVAIFVKTKHWERQEILGEFRLESQQSADKLQMYLHEQSLLLHQLSQFMRQDANRDVTRNEFSRYVHPILARFPMIQAIEWAPRVKSSQRLSFEAHQRATVPGFRITEREYAGKMVSAATRADYYPVTYMEPYKGNAQAMGFDLLSQGTRRLALQSAIRSGHAAATAPVHLVQERDGQRAILLIYPTPNGNRVPGVALMVLRMGSFINKILSSRWTSLRMQLVDKNTRQVLFNNFPLGNEANVYQTEFMFGGRLYQLNTEPTRGYMLRHKSWHSEGVLVMGVVGTIMFGFILLLVSGYSGRLEEEVSTRTEALKHSESRLQEITNTLAEGVYVLDNEGRVQFINPEAERLLGWRKDELLGDYAHTRFHMDPTDSRILADRKCAIAAVTETGDVYRSDKEVFYRKDGSPMPVYVVSAPIERDGKRVGAVAAFADVTERKRAEAALSESEERFRLMGSAATEAIIIIGERGEVTYWNPAAESIFGYSAGETFQKRVHDLIMPEHYCDDHERGYAVFSVSGTGPLVGKTFEITAKRKSGEEFPIEMSLSAFKLRDAWYAMGVIRDISERKRNEQEYRTIIQTTRDGFLVVDAHDGHFVDVNDAYCELVGYARDEVLSMETADVEAMVSPVGIRQAQEALRRIGYAQFETRHRRKDGSEVDVEVTATYLEIRGGVFITFVRDISERKQAEEKIRKLAYYDHLTNLPNRVLLVDRMKQALSQARRYHRPMAIMFLDLDYFKQINDTLGHDSGDELLKSVAQRLTRAVRDGDTVCRQGGDEFVIVLAELAKEQDAELVARKILAAMSPPFLIKDNEFGITTSIGIAMYHIDSDDDCSELMKKADMAMYSAKSSGRNGYRFYGE